MTQIAYKIIACENLTPEEDKTVQDGFTRHTTVHVGEEPKPQKFAFKVMQDKKIMAVAHGKIYTGLGMSLSVLWVHEDLRGQGIGKALMENVLDLAKDEKCNFIDLTTMEWQAREFYEGYGFVVDLVRDGYVNNTKKYFMRLTL